MAAAQHHHGISCSLRRQSGLFRIVASPAGRAGAAETHPVACAVRGLARDADKLCLRGQVLEGGPP